MVVVITGFEIENRQKKGLKNHSVGRLAHLSRRGKSDRTTQFISWADLAPTFLGLLYI